MEMQMKTLIAALALAAVIAAPAFTQSAFAGSNDVIVNGKNYGTDPDLNVRLQIRRDAGSENY
jgi:hypothetical protein